MENKEKEEVAVSELMEINLNRCFFNETYKKRLEKSGIKQFREIIRDGNCMYLTIGVQLVNKIQKNETFKEEFKRRLENIKEKFKSLHLEEFVYADYISTFENGLLEEIHKIDKYGWYEIVGLLRLFVSTEMRTNQEDYAPYLVDTTVERYCKLNVDPFFVEAGYLEIGALVNILGIQIAVYDVTENSENLLRLYGTKGERINILHTPNHFEPIYF